MKIENEIATRVLVDSKNLIDLCADAGSCLNGVDVIDKKKEFLLKSLQNINKKIKQINKDCGFLKIEMPQKSKPVFDRSFTGVIEEIPEEILTQDGIDKVSKNLDGYFQVYNLQMIILQISRTCMRLMMHADLLDPKKNG